MTYFKSDQSEIEEILTVSKFLPNYINFITENVNILIYL